MKGSIEYTLLKIYEGKGFRSECINATLTTAGSPFALFKNPSGSGKTMILAQSVLTAGGGTINDSAEIQYFRAPTISTNGTTVTSYNSNIGNVSATATVNVFCAPTISADGNEILHAKVYVGHDSLIIPHEGKLQVSANNNLYVKVTSSTASVSLAASFLWLEL